MNGRPPENKCDIFNITSLKSEQSGKSLFAQGDILKVIQSLSDAGYGRIILAISPKEISIDDENSFVQSLSQFGSLYLYEDYMRKPGDSFGAIPAFLKFPRHAEFTFTRDTRFDNVTRRLLLYYDLEKHRYISDFDNLTKQFELPFQASDFYPGSFEYLDSINVYLKIWPQSYLTTFDWSQWVSSSHKEKTR